MSYECPHNKEKRSEPNASKDRENKGDPNRKAEAKVVTREYKLLSAVSNHPKEKKGQGIWMLDGGASDHMTSDKELFVEFRKSEGHVIVGNGEPLKIEGIGKIKLSISTECGGYDLGFAEALYVPELVDNLISQGTLEKKGYKIVSYNGVSEISLDDVVYLKCFRVGTLYYVTTEDGTSISELKQMYEAELVNKKASRVSFVKWHERLGHLNPADMAKIRAIDLKDGTTQEGCGVCCAGKMKRSPFTPSELQENVDILDRIHSDLMGPIKPASLGENRRQ